MKTVFDTYSKPKTRQDMKKKKKKYNTTYIENCRSHEEE